MSAIHAETNANIVTFITTDPLSVGFAAIRAATPGDQPLITAANNVNGPGAGTVAGDPISYADFFALLDAGEWNSLTSPQLAQLQSFGQQVNMGDAGAQSKVNALFADFAVTKAALTAKFTRPAGPWEVYFGKGNLATIGKLDAARNSGSGNNF